MLSSKELTFNNFDKCVHDITNTPIAKEQISFWSKKHKVYTVTSNKIATHNGNNKEIQEDYGITRYCFGSNISFINHFNGKEVPSSIGELKQIYEEFIR